MSETKQTKRERVPYEVVLAEPLPFEADFSGKITTSNGFCKLVNNLYKQAFADYEGCTFDVVNGIPLFSFYFNHKPVVDGKVYACERGVNSTSVGSTYLEKTRNRDRLLKEGDRYRITEDGKDVITKLLHPRYYNNGKPQWNNIVTEITDNSTATYWNNRGTQMTKITGIDARKIAAVLWGEGDNSDYGIEVKGNLSFNNQAVPGTSSSNNFVLYINKAFTDVINRTYESLGIVNSGSPIIR